MAKNEPRIEEIVRAMLTGSIDYRAAELQIKPIDIRALREQKAKLARSLIAQLSEPEQDILKSVVEGHSRKYAAEKLGSDSETIDGHLAEIKNKLNALSASDLVRIALFGGLKG